MKVYIGKEWNDDGNNNCLVYEGGYCNGERWGKGKSYDLNGNDDFEGEWMNNHVISENDKDDLKNDIMNLRLVKKCLMTKISLFFISHVMVMMVISNDRIVEIYSINWVCEFAR